MTLLTKLICLITRFTRLHSPTTLMGRNAWNDVIKTIPDWQESDKHGNFPLNTRVTPHHVEPRSESGNPLRIQARNRTNRQMNPPHRADDAFDDRRVPRDPTAVHPVRRRRVKNHPSISVTQAALALLFELTLNQAEKIIDALPQTTPTLVDLDIEQRAFMRIRSHLEQQNLAQQPAHCLPLLTLLARRVGHLNDPAQREQAMNLLTQSLKTYPQIEVVEALSMALTDMPADLQQRALDHIEEFMRRTSDIAQLHVDILQALTHAIRIESCRQRAVALITAGLKRLRNEPELCALIRQNLALAYCAEGQTIQFQA